MKLILLPLVALTIVGCGDIEDTEEYQTGYDAGYEVGHEEGKIAGLEEGREEICDEIEYRLNSGARDAVCD